MTLMRHFTCICLALFTISAGSQLARADTLRIGYLVWVGFGPMFVAQEKGFFAKEGVEVELINMAAFDAAYAGLFAGQVDAIGATVDDMVPRYDPEQPHACVLAQDESLGADGILAANDIQSIADLKGKVVGRGATTVSQFFLNVLLQDAGLSEADIEPVDLGAEDVSDAFLLQEIDAAVTWEPFLTDGAQSEHGHILVNSTETPGLIVDCLITKIATLDQRVAEFRAVARAWDAAVAYVEANPEEGIVIMASHVGGWLEDPAVFAESLEGVRFADAKRNRELFGTPDAPGPIYKTSQYAIDIWSSLGMLDHELSPADVIRHDVVVE